MSSFFFAGKVYTFPIEHASTPTGPLACIYSIDLSVLQSNKSYWTARVEFLENKDPASRGKVKSRAVIRKPSREAFPDSEEAWAAGPPEFWTWTKEEILDSAPHYLRICLHSGGFLCVQFLHDMREYYSIAEFHLVTLASVEGFRLRSPDREENVWTNADFSWRKRVASEILHLPLELRAADVTEESLPCACGQCIFFQLHMRRDEASFSSSLCLPCPPTPRALSYRCSPARCCRRPGRCTCGFTRRSSTPAAAT